MYLVDTNVLSAAAPTKARIETGLVEWIDRNSDKLFISVITIAEIEAGIAKLRDNGSLKKAQRLSEWLETLLHLYQHRVLPLDLQAARELGCMTQAVKSGWPYARNGRPVDRGDSDGEGLCRADPQPATFPGNGEHSS